MSAAFLQRSDPTPEMFGEFGLITRFAPDIPGRESTPEMFGGFGRISTCSARQLYRGRIRPLECLAGLVQIVEFPHDTHLISTS